MKYIGNEDAITNTEHNCTLWAYSPGHSQLVIRAVSTINDQNVIYIIFFMTWHFNGPLSWSGKIENGPTARMMEILRSIKGFDKMEKDYLVKNFCLFRGASNGRIIVDIVAQAVEYFKADEIGQYVPWFQVLPNN